METPKRDSEGLTILVTIDGKQTPYELGEAEFNGHEWGIIERIAGLRAGELDDAQKAGNVRLMYAMAAIAMRRAGKKVDEDEILNLAGSAIKAQGDDTDDADPPEAGDAAAGDDLET